jgi:hypothetical protein
MHPTSVATSVETVRTIVLLELILSFVKGELTLLDTVGITTYA